MLVFICIYLIINDVEHLFSYLLVICITPLEKYLLRSSAHSLVRYLFFLILTYMSYLYISESKPL